ncbi:MAG: hypothetical protein U0166_04470 [Acidobacteriota bacterium]
MDAILAARRGPSLLGELRRGFSTGNLATAIAVAVPVALAVVAFGTIATAVVSGVAAFVAITALHVALHAYFGWRFERGMAALHAGDAPRARRLLGIVAMRGIDHYDPDGAVRDALSRLS